MSIHEAGCASLPAASLGGRTCAAPRLLIAACDGAHRRSLVSFLQERGHEVVVAPSIPEAIAWVRIGVDLVITGHTMPGLCGYELTKSLRSLYPDLPVILLSAGMDVLNPRLLECVVPLDAEHGDRGGDDVEETSANAGQFAKLTARERQVLNLVVAGHGNKSVARALSISPRTVENHRARIMQKTSAPNLAALVHQVILYAQRAPDTAGIVPIGGQVVRSRIAAR